MRFLRYLLPCFLLVSSAFAALPAAMVWECRVGGSGASQNNGGGFLSGTSGVPVDYSIQDANHFTSTAFKMKTTKNAIWNSSGTAFDTADVNNVLHITAGTGWLAGWYQITAVDVNATATLDRNLVTSTYTANSGTGCLGGAFKIGGTLDDDFFEAKIAGNTIWIAAGTYTLGETIASTVVGTAIAPITVTGYNSSRGDAPVGSNRPLLNCGTYLFGLETYSIHNHLQFTGSGSFVVYLYGTYETFVNCKFSTTSLTGPAFETSSGGACTLIGCELSARKGSAFQQQSVSHRLINCYIHDSATGIRSLANGLFVYGCVIETCTTGIDSGSSADLRIIGNTIRNCLTGISGSSSYGSSFINNIIADCVTGASWTTATPINFWDYNCWSNNDTAVSNVTKGSHDVTADALLVSGTAKGTDGVTSASGLVFTAATNPFGSVTTSDCLNITVAGTGATLGVYVISSVDGAGQLTLATSAGASKTGITYCITLGTDFTLGAGSPCFNAGLKLGSDVGL